MDDVVGISTAVPLDAEADRRALEDRITQEAAAHRCTVRQMTPEERAKHPVVHPTTAEVREGAESGKTLEMVAEASGGDLTRAWHVARRNGWLDKFRANAKQHGKPMFRPGEISTIPPAPSQNTAASPEPESPRFVRAVPEELVAEVASRLEGRLAAWVENLLAQKQRVTPEPVTAITAALQRVTDDEHVGEGDQALLDALEHMIRATITPDLESADEAVSDLVEKTQKQLAEMQKYLKAVEDHLLDTVRELRRHQHQMMWTSPPLRTVAAE